MMQRKSDKRSNRNKSSKILELLCIISAIFCVLLARPAISAPVELEQLEYKWASVNSGGIVGSIHLREPTPFGKFARIRLVHGLGPVIENDGKKALEMWVSNDVDAASYNMLVNYLKGLKIQGYFKDFLKDIWKVSNQQEFDEAKTIFFNAYGAMIKTIAKRTASEVIKFEPYRPAVEGLKNYQFFVKKTIDPEGLLWTFGDHQSRGVAKNPEISRADIEWLYNLIKELPGDMSAGKRNKALVEALVARKEAGDLSQGLHASEAEWKIEFNCR